MKHLSHASERVAALGLALLLASSFVQADETASSDASTFANDSEDIEDVVVSARKRTEKLQDVPLSISSVSGSALEQGAYYSIQDLSAKVPNLLTAPSNPRQTSIAIRGLGKNSANDGLETSVGVYVDGVYLAQSGETTFDLADLDHVEVLRGPQGTLFGKNNTGGALSIYTRLPSFSPSVEAEAVGGNYATYELHASATGPLSDTVAYRVTAYDRKRDGFLTNIYDGAHFDGYDRQGVRGQLLVNPTSGLSIRLIAEYYRSDEQTGVSVLYNPLTHYANGAPNTHALTRYTQPLGFVPVFDPWSRQIDDNSAQPVTTQQLGGSAQITWHLGDYTLDSITALRRYDFAAHNDLDGTPLDIVTWDGTTSHNKHYSQELRLSSPSASAFQYVAGLYYFRQDLWTDSDTLYGPQYAAFAGDGTNTPAALNNVQQDVIGTPTTRSYAGFLQADYHLNSAWTITAGARETHESKAATISELVSGGTPDAALSADDYGLRYSTVTTGESAVSFSQNALSWLGSLSWRLNDDVNTYITAARGFKSGGINVEVTNVPLVVAPETALDYEAGIKALVPSGHVELNADVYWSTIHNYQGNFQSPTLGSYIASVGDVRVRGVEFEAAARPSESLRLGVGASYNQATYQNFINAGCPPELKNVASICNLSGRQLPFAPLWTGNFFAEYTHPIGRDLTGFFDTNAIFRSAANVNQSLSEYGVQGPYSVTDMQLGLRGRNATYDVSFWVKNAFDRRYITAVATTFSSRSLTAALGDPRTFGATLRVRF
jgi:iron complex outermembrane recepter protein